MIGAFLGAAAVLFHLSRRPRGCWNAQCLVNRTGSVFGQGLVETLLRALVQLAATAC